MNQKIQEAVNKAKDASNIVEVMREFLTLQKAGVNYKAVCPFHDDRTPSLFVSPSKQIYHCFVCGAGGDVLTFLQEHEKMSFIEAAKWLCKKYNVDFPEREMTDEEQQQYQEVEAQRIAMKAAADYYQKQLRQAQSFLQQRGYAVDDPVLQKYGVGYAPMGGVIQSELVARQGYALDRMKQVDLVRQGDGGRDYDTFRDRLVFPFYDRRGNVVAFSGRLVTPSDKLPKYLNTGETPLFTKGNHLFGLYQARQAIGRQGFVYLVEGQFDVMTLARYGVENVVGGSGTAFTPEQVRLLQVLTSEVRMIYDSDKAGMKASLKNCEILLQAGFVVKCVTLPEGKDPDEFAMKHGDQTQKLLDNFTQSFPRALKSMLIPRGSKDENVIGAAINTICRLVACVGDNGLRLEYIKGMAKDFRTRMNILEEKVRKARQDVKGVSGTDIKPGLYGLDELKAHLEDDQPAILTSDMQEFLSQYEDTAIVLCSGRVSDEAIQKLRSTYGYFITGDAGCSMDPATAVESDYLYTLAQMYRMGITDITVTRGSSAESLLDFYIHVTGKLLEQYQGDTVPVVNRCIELTSYAEDSVITIRRNAYCSQLKLTRGQFDDLRRPYIQARKASLKVSQLSGGLDDSEYFDPNDPPQYVKDNEGYMRMWREYGFYPRLNQKGEPVCYMFRNKDGSGMTQVGDFYMTPLLHIFSDDYDQNKRVLKVNRRHRNTPIYIEVVSKSLLKMTSIEELLCNYDAVNFSNGEEWKWKKIKEYMSLNYTTCSEVKIYGNQQQDGTSRRQDEQFFAFANGIAHMVGDKMQFSPIDELGVVAHNSQNYYLPAFSTIYAGQGRQSEKYEFISQLVYNEVPKEKQMTFDEWASLMDTVYKINDNGKFAIVFALMCAFRSNIHCIDRIFTAPFFAGPMSSGKTQIAISIRSLFISPHTSIFNLNTGTDAAMQTYMSAFKDVPVVLDEFNQADISNIKLQALKSIVYDGEERLKKKGSSGKDFESDKVYTPVIVCGQEPPMGLDDNSLTSRMVICEVPKPKNRTAEETAHFDRLKYQEDPTRGGGLHNILLEVLALRPAVMDHFRPLRQQAYEELKQGVENEGVRDRMMKTFSLFLGMVKLVELYSDFHLPFTYAEFFQLVRKKIDWQISLISSTDKLATFFTSVNNLIDERRIISGRDFFIKTGGKISGKDPDGHPHTFVFAPGQDILLLRLSTVFDRVEGAGRVESGVNQSTISQNLRSHPSYLGTVDSARFGWTEIIEVTEGDKVIKKEQVRTTTTSAVLLEYSRFLRDYPDFRRTDEEHELADEPVERKSNPEEKKDPEEKVLPF